MAHTKYHTNAFVIDGVDTGEADRFMTLFTEDFGLLGVHTRSLRKISSKQRYGLQKASYSRVSLVKGRNIWRLTNVSPKDNYYHKYGGGHRSNFVLETLVFLQRFVQGQETNKELFNCIKAAFSNLAALDSQKHLKAKKYLTQLRVLFLLGYVGDEIKVLDEKTLLHDYFDTDILDKVYANRSKVEKLISKGYRESQL